MSAASISEPLFTTSTAVLTYNTHRALNKSLSCFDQKTLFDPNLPIPVSAAVEPLAPWHTLHYPRKLKTITWSTKLQIKKSANARSMVTFANVSLSVICILRQTVSTAVPTDEVSAAKYELNGKDPPRKKKTTKIADNNKRITTNPSMSRILGWALA
eukprot:GHVU01137214.1.p2 GENE.GHVU01137214.1~~GHVU01137214.1.p2  ORF type:complete len:157 (-),score=9.98 GHVU01137214.1:196-666(-)